MASWRQRTEEMPESQENELRGVGSRDLEKWAGEPKSETKQATCRVYEDHCTDPQMQPHVAFADEVIFSDEPPVEFPPSDHHKSK